MIKVEITTEAYGLMGTVEVSSLEHIKQSWSHMSGVTFKVI
jgi:hypothetical protein